MCIFASRFKYLELLVTHSLIRSGYSIFIEEVYNKAGMNRSRPLKSSPSLFPITCLSSAFQPTLFSAQVVE
jgi:hypothetical protein